MKNQVTVCLDETQCNQKPNKTNVQKIMANFGSKQRTLTIHELAECLVQPKGYTVCPAVFSSEKAQNKYWKAQQLFFIDIDHGLSFQDAIERCKKYQVLPVFAYTTFSDVDETRYRLVFYHWESITDRHVHQLILKAFLFLFPEADKSCKDLSRKFYGGKNLLYENYESKIDLIQLIDQTCYLFKKEKKSNANKFIKKYCDSLGILYNKGTPAYTYVSTDDSEKEVTFFGGPYILYKKEPLKKVYIQMAGPISERGENDREQKQKATFPYHDYKEKIELKIESITNSCQLFYEFQKAEIWLYYPELFGLASNLMCIKGGRSCFISGLHARPEYGTEEGKNREDFFKYYALNHMAKNKYYPERCEKYCRYANHCYHHTKNIITTTQLENGEVKILNQPEYCSIEEAERQLDKHIEYCLTIEEDGVFLIDAETGLGKTEKYIHSKDLGSIVIALPRHDLKNQVAERFKKAGKEIIVYPDPPELDKKDKKILNQFYATGAYEAAQSFLYKQRQFYPEVDSYFKTLDQVKHHDGIVLATHDRVIQNPDYFSQEKVLFDEDLMGGLIKHNRISLQELKDLIEYPLLHLEEAEKENLKRHIQYLENLKKNKIQKRIPVLPNSILEKKSSIAWDIKRLRAEKRIFSNERTKTNSQNIFDFFDCKRFYIDEHDIIHYVNVGNLNFKKIIVLSATPNKLYYEKLFGDKCKIFTVQRAVPGGTILQDLSHPLSRIQIYKQPQLIKAVSEYAGETPVITYKKYENIFSNSVAHFGGLTGLDEYKGSNLIIAGTPHFTTQCYFLDATALGIKCNPEKEKMVYQIVEFKGMRFFFNSFVKNPELQILQLTKIEAELKQAIGRARPLREKCTITVFSNFPIIGAEYKKFTLDIKDDASEKVS
ncbi:MAG: DEAD/DEAH box helicase family protein [Spirochaetia bacterium]|nr:DEAD/DEAH box helicase family protein [Spirochaetia bacterium]MCF7945891.1 DEAD/DEAH box helicase family protein [Spirochaetia bacterium]